MTKYIKNHEAYLLTSYAKEDLHLLLDYHNRQIIWLQHERLVHLLIMLFTSMLFMASFIVNLFFISITFVILVTLLGLLSFAYILHYYRLENTIQRWYKISNKFQYELNAIGTNLSEKI